MATIDERLDRLTERHVALAGSLQLLTQDVRDTQSSIKAIVTQLDRVITTITTLAVNIGELGEVARMHERRIERLESQ